MYKRTKGETEVDTWSRILQRSSIWETLLLSKFINPPLNWTFSSFLLWGSYKPFSKSEKFLRLELLEQTVSIQMPTFYFHAEGYLLGFQARLLLFKSWWITDKNLSKTLDRFQDLSVLSSYPFIEYLEVPINVEQVLRIDRRGVLKNPTIGAAMQAHCEGLYTVSRACHLCSGDFNCRFNGHVSDNVGEPLPYLV